MVVVGVFGSVEESNGVLAGAFGKVRESRFMVSEFGAVALFEFGPFLGVGVEPFAEFGGGGEVFGPVGEAGAFAGDASGPEAIDEDAVSVFFGGGLVDALEPDHPSRRL